jgi:hypothetical protein
VSYQSLRHSLLRGPAIALPPLELLMIHSTRHAFQGRGGLDSDEAWLRSRTLGLRSDHL